MTLGRSDTFQPSNIWKRLGLADRTRKFQGAFAIHEAPFKLRFLHRQEDFLVTRAGPESHGIQVVPGYQLGRAHLPRRSFGDKLMNKVVGVKAAVAGEALVV